MDYVTKADLENTATILKADIENTATILKADLENTATILKKDIHSSIKKSENRIIKKLNIIIDHFERISMDHEKRISRLENHTGLTV